MLNNFFFLYRILFSPSGTYVFGPSHQYITQFANFSLNFLYLEATFDYDYFILFSSWRFHDYIQEVEVLGNIDGVAVIFVIDILMLQYRPKGPQVMAQPIAGARMRVAFPPSYEKERVTDGGKVSFPPSYERGKVIHLHILPHNKEIWVGYFS